MYLRRGDQTSYRRIVTYVDDDHDKHDRKRYFSAPYQLSGQAAVNASMQAEIAEQVMRSPADQRASREVMDELCSHIQTSVALPHDLSFIATAATAKVAPKWKDQLPAVMPMNVREKEDIMKVMGGPPLSSIKNPHREQTYCCDDMTGDDILADARRK